MCIFPIEMGLKEKFKIKKQQKLKAKKKAYKFEEQLINLILKGHINKALEESKEMLTRYNNNVRFYRFWLGMQAWIEHIEPFLKGKDKTMREIALNLLRERWRVSSDIDGKVLLAELQKISAS
ncbi:MAG TPA: hypothetical protein EYP60_00375 [bacterium (Candidatus Stahlbacteria)]|nr:hypothetical protein [Candidatus Stahlbacteria bacterium]